MSTSPYSHLSADSASGPKQQSTFTYPFNKFISETADGGGCVPIRVLTVDPVTYSYSIQQSPKITGFQGFQCIGSCLSDYCRPFLSDVTTLPVPPQNPLFSPISSQFNHPPPSHTNCLQHGTQSPRKPSPGPTRHPSPNREQFSSLISHLPSPPPTRPPSDPSPP